jgi:hypothetical protein
MVKLRYRLEYKSSTLLPEKYRAEGMKAWILIKEVIDPDSKTTVAYEDVAIFNFDTEATTFMRFLDSGSNVEIPDDMKELFVLQKRNLR